MADNSAKASGPESVQAELTNAAPVITVSIEPLETGPRAKIGQVITGADAVEISRQGNLAGELKEKEKTLQADIEPVKTAPRGAISWAQAFAGFIGRLRQFTATIRDSTAFIRAMLARSVTKFGAAGKLLAPSVREAKGKAAAKSGGQVHLRPLPAWLMPLGGHIASHATKTNMERVPVKRITVFWRSFVKARSRPPVLRVAIPHAGRDLVCSIVAGVMDKRPPKPMEHQVIINVPTKHGMVRCVAARLNTTAWGVPTVKMHLRIKSTLLAGLQRLLEPCSILVPVTVSAQKLESIQAVRLGGWRYLAGVKVTGQAVSILPTPVRAGDLNSSETKGTAHYFPAKVQIGTYLAPALETGCITTGTTAALAGGYLVPCNEKGRAVILPARQMASKTGNWSRTSKPEMPTPYAAPASGNTLHYSLNAVAGAILLPAPMASSVACTAVAEKGFLQKAPAVPQQAACSIKSLHRVDLTTPVLATPRGRVSIKINTGGVNLDSLWWPWFWVDNGWHIRQAYETTKTGDTLNLFDKLPVTAALQIRAMTKINTGGVNLDSLWWPWFWVDNGWHIRQTHEATLADGILEVK